MKDSTARSEIAHKEEKVPGEENFDFNENFLKVGLKAPIHWLTAMKPGGKCPTLNQI